MTRTDLERLRERQRHYEWELARSTHAAAAATLVAGKTHALLNVVQIVQLATAELARRCDPTGQEFIDDLTRAGASAEARLVELMAAARPDIPVVRGAPVGQAITAAIELVRAHVAIDLRIELAAETATRCTAEDLEHLVIGLALDVLEIPDTGPRIKIVVREREIESKPWVELVRGPLPRSWSYELTVVEAIAVRGGGELARSDSADGTEVIVALPVVAAPGDR